MVSAPLTPAPDRERSLCVSVVSHGHGAHVDQLIADLAALPAGTVSRVVVTVNVAGDAWLPKIAVPGAEIEVLRNTAPQGFAVNHNLAFAHCAEACFAVVNPDIRLGGDPFPALLNKLRGESFAMVVPVQTDAEGHLESFARELPNPFSVAARRLLPNGRRGIEGIRPTWVSGAFMVWRAEAFRAIGGFDAGYFLYCEDVDICLRLRLANQRFAVVESARVIHDAQRASVGSPRYLVQHIRSLLRLWTSAVYWRYLRAEPRLAAAHP